MRRRVTFIVFNNLGTEVFMSQERMFENVCSCCFLDKLKQTAREVWDSYNPGAKIAMSVVTGRDVQGPGFIDFPTRP
jgi:hypothetical protein